MDPEVLRDLLQRGLRISGPRDSDYVFAELLGERLGRCNILSARSLDQTDQLSPIRAADPILAVAIGMIATPSVTAAAAPGHGDTWTDCSGPLFARSTGVATKPRV